MSRKLLLPKSPLEDIFINFPFWISPINLKFLRFSDSGAITFLKSISIFLLIFVIVFFEFLLFKIWGSLLASKRVPLIFILSSNKTEKSLFFFHLNTF